MHLCPSAVLSVVRLFLPFMGDLNGYCELGWGAGLEKWRGWVPQSATDQIPVP